LGENGSLKVEFIRKRGVGEIRRLQTETKSCLRRERRGRCYLEEVKDGDKSVASF